MADLSKLIMAGKGAGGGGGDTIFKSSRNWGRGGTIFSFCVLDSMNGRGGGRRYNF